MVGHLLAAVPCQRFIEFVWKLMGVLDERTDDSLGIFAIDLCQHEVARLTLHQRCNLAVLTTEEQIAFPVARYRSVFDGCWPLTDGDSVNDSTMNAGFLRVVSRTAYSSRPSQMRHQLLLQSAAGLYEQTAIDGLV